MAGPTAVVVYLYPDVFEINIDYRCAHKAPTLALEAVSLPCHSRYLGCGKPWDVFWKPGYLSWSFSWNERPTWLSIRRA